jgi:hypothetical protein
VVPYLKGRYACSLQPQLSMRPHDAHRRRFRRSSSWFLTRPRRIIIHAAAAAVAIEIVAFGSRVIQIL